jgi:hypothetical protein
MAPCTPALNFVQNGAAGSAFPPPMDPANVPVLENKPTFEETACSLLGQDLCSGMDTISSIDELSALVDTIDTFSTAADSQLDAILLELDQLGHDQVNNAFDAFSGAQPGAESLLGGVTQLALPALGQIPMVLPNGAATITFGGPPETGGVVHAGAPDYVLHVPLIGALGGTHNVDADGADGPNPPFTSFGPAVRETLANGEQWWVYLVHVHPAHAGNFTAVLHYLANVTITGITGTLKLSKPIEVVIEP